MIGRQFSHALSFVAGILVMFGVGMMNRSDAQSPNHVFELRMYHVPDGKYDALKNRFRDHVLAAFGRHNMKGVGFWMPQDAPDAGKLFIYVLEHPSRQEAEKNWAAFNADPEWLKAKADSEVNGKLVEKVDRYFMDPADFSPIK
jgi:hypothetical protein